MQVKGPATCFKQDFIMWQWSENGSGKKHEEYANEMEDFSLFIVPFGFIILG